LLCEIPARDDREFEFPSTFAGEEQMTLSEVIAFFEAQSKELCPWRAKESIERAYD
jgi:hypothetical protein